MNKDIDMAFINL